MAYLILADPLVVGVAWEGGCGVLVEHVALHSELGLFGCLSADTKKVGNLVEGVPGPQPEQQV